MSITSEEFSNEYDSSDNTNSTDNTDDMDFDLKGKILNKYNVINEIGRGADAIVWLALNIEDSKYYAIKVNEPNEYEKGLEEFKFIKKLPPKATCFNHLKESFVEKIDNKKYSCGVFELHTGNLDALVRKGDYQDGLKITLVKKIMFQVLSALKHLHTKLKVYHADIKTDNILLQGINRYDKYVIQEYDNCKFFEVYKKEKLNFWLGQGKKEDTIDKIPKEHKLKIRKEIHNSICEKINFPDKTERYKIDENFVNTALVSLSDFGAWCGEDEHYDTDFGTRYYRAPEVILLGESSYPVDIWAAGCVFYELLTGRILFNPEKDHRSRDEHHLYLINKSCGNFNIGFLKTTKNWKKYFNSSAQLINFNKEDDEFLEDRSFKYRMNKYGINENQEEILDLLKGMLTISPNQRFNITKCLAHPFFKEFK